MARLCEPWQTALGTICEKTREVRTLRCIVLIGAMLCVHSRIPRSIRPIVRPGPEDVFMDTWHVVAFLLFFVSPALGVGAGLVFLDRTESGEGVGWRGGARDPFRLVAYDDQGQLRPYFRPTAWIVLLAYLLGVGWLACYEFSR